MNRINKFKNIFIDKSLPIPIYFQIEKIIIDLIENKKLEVGEQLPTEEELCKIFNTSRMTIRQAFSSLTKEGYIVKKKAKGTFVASNKINFELSKLHSFSEDMISRGFKVTNKILEKRIIKYDKKVYSKLNLADKTQEVLKLKRLRYINDLPAAVETSYIPLDKCPNIQKEILKDKSLFKIFIEKYNLRISHSKQTLIPIIASKDIASVLKIKEGTPLIKMEGITFLNNDIPIEFVIGIYNGERYKFTIKMTG